MQTQNSINSQQIKDLESHIEKQYIQKGILDNLLVGKIKFQQFNSIEEALSVRLSFEEAQQLIAEKQLLEEQFKVLQTQKEMVNNDYKSLKMSNISLTIEELNQNISQLQEKLTENTKNTEELRFILRDYDQNKLEIQQLNQKIQHEIEKNR